ncbi:hypothetical protein CEY16_05525 [Halalkalibacillus sediminis]|uniref:2-methylcitrate dehydratase n=1 Tax=Halalkalibacillus sediminis TaxID=2018042 RepID=A0A2I0QXZ5_9BACI|nr:hypothetical protein [Halalkalibacillus sediminis]PKR79203.1 hypothetical protein CEY16_05525 [Halalkalibacillus sediminis]
MTYTNFKALVKKVNLKPKGIQEVVLEVSDAETRGQLENLANMIDTQAYIDIESTIVRYNVTVDAQSHKPLKEYKVDKRGIVQEVKDPEQLELPGIPKEERKTEEKELEVDKEALEQFVLNDMAPDLDDFPENITRIVKRKLEGESYSKIASDLNMNSGKIAKVIDEYFKQIAPLAEKWWEWKQEQKPGEGKNDNNDQGNDDNESDEGAA